MIVLQPQVLVPQNQLDGEIVKRLERYGRVCYKSEQAMNPEGNPEFVSGKLRLGHESIIEHEKVTLMFVCDRGVTHELVRHRIAAYSQESTRYCNYGKDKFGREIAVIEPYFFKDDPRAYDMWARACQESEDMYMALLDAGRSAQEARSVLPNSLKTEIVVTFNMREWRHFFRLRADAAAHPQMRQVAIPLLLLFKERFPALYSDIPYDKSFPREHYASIVMTDDMFEIL